jgi:hypothetical protein
MPPHELLSATALTSHGWTRIGATDSAERRSVWMRLTYRADALCGANGLPLEDTSETVAKIEIRAGREGDDLFATFEPSNPQFSEILGVFLAARYAVQS